MEDTPEQSLLRLKEEDNISFTPEQIIMLKKIMEETDKELVASNIKDALEGFKLNEEPQLIAQISTDNDKLNYDIVNLNVKQLKDQKNYIAGSKVDYNIPRDEDAIRKGFEEDMPISFLSIK